MELLFVSGSHSHFSSSSPDYHFRLSNGLPHPHTAKPWNRTRIPPLRDRLMVEWLFAQREALKELSVIVKSLDQELDKLSPPGDASGYRIKGGAGDVALRKVIVGISCEDGFELSPCFVEKLYDHYKTTPPIDSLVVVKRQHTHAEPRRIQKERLKWQHYSNSSTYLRRKSESDRMKHIKQVITSKDWLNMPQELSDSIENAFNKDPLQTSVKIENVIVDFESGEMTSLLTKQISLLRCTLLPKDYTIRVRRIDHQIYKSFVRSYEAAGILPYSVHPVTGEAVFLLGKLTYDRGTWCDFGGMKSRYKVFRETPAYTAARECFEESLGVFGSTEQLVHALKNYKDNNVFKVVNEGSDYVGHYLRIPFDHYPSKFATRHLERAGELNAEVEVESMRWVPLSSMRKAVGQVQLSAYGFVKVQPINELDGSIDSSNYLKLRSPFTQSLCIAEDYGILDFIENIAFIFHKGGGEVGGVGLQQREDFGSPPPQDKQKKRNSMDLTMLQSTKTEPNKKEEQGTTRKEEQPGTIVVPFKRQRSATLIVNNMFMVGSAKDGDGVANVGCDHSKLSKKLAVSLDNLTLTSVSHPVSKGVSPTNDTSSDPIDKDGVGVATHTNDPDDSDEVKSKIARDCELAYQAAERRGMMYYGMISGSYSIHGPYYMSV